MTTSRPNRTITREKHLDHLVKVVPLIVFGYALQCYILTGMGPLALSVDTLIFLGISLGFMIGAFIVHDLKHQVHFYDDHFTVQWPFQAQARTISYSEIAMIEANEEDQNFSNLVIRTRAGQKFTFYFVDDASVIKKWLQERPVQNIPAAA